MFVIIFIHKIYIYIYIIIVGSCLILHTQRNYIHSISMRKEMVTDTLSV